MGLLLLEREGCLGSLPFFLLLVCDVEGHGGVDAVLFGDDGVLLLSFGLLDDVGYSELYEVDKLGDG